MSELKEAIEAKFAEAQDLYLAGLNPFAVQDSVWKQKYETIGLDSELEPELQYRYLISRCSINTPTPRFAEGLFGDHPALSITNLLVQAPRMKGDHRAFEDLPADAIAGKLLLYDAIKNLLLEYKPGQLVSIDKLSVYALSSQIKKSRVATSLPSL